MRPQPKRTAKTPPVTPPGAPRTLKP
jgi:hypothetical protein